jgi:hypothetical protein
MFNPQTMLDYHHQHHRELLAEARRRQTVVIARAGRRPAKLFYHDTLAALGRRLCTWGEHLQERYSPVELSVAGETSL